MNTGYIYIYMYTVYIYIYIRVCVSIYVYLDSNRRFLAPAMYPIFFNYHRHLEGVKSLT